MIYAYDIIDQTRKKLMENAEFKNYDPTKGLGSKHEINSNWFGLLPIDVIVICLLEELQSLLDREKSHVSKTFDELKAEISKRYIASQEKLNKYDNGEISQEDFLSSSKDLLMHYVDIFDVLYGFDILLQEKDKIEQLKMAQAIQSIYAVGLTNRIPGYTRRKTAINARERKQENYEKKVKMAQTKVKEFFDKNPNATKIDALKYFQDNLPTFIQDFNEKKLENIIKKHLLQMK